MRNFILSVVWILVPAAAGAAELGDADRGFAYVQRNCSECHAVEPDGAKSPNPAAPTFMSVAETPAITARALVVWLQSSHPTMPNLMIEPEDRDDVVAYIMSLRSETK